PGIRPASSVRGCDRLPLPIHPRSFRSSTLALTPTLQRGDVFRVFTVRLFLRCFASLRRDARTSEVAGERREHCIERVVSHHTPTSYLLSSQLMNFHRKI